MEFVWDSPYFVSLPQYNNVLRPHNVPIWAAYPFVSSRSLLSPLPSPSSIPDSSLTGLLAVAQLFLPPLPWMLLCSHPHFAQHPPVSPGRGPPDEDHVLSSEESLESQPHWASSEGQCAPRTVPQRDHLTRSPLFLARLGIRVWDWFPSIALDRLHMVT